MPRYETEIILTAKEDLEKLLLQLGLEQDKIEEFINSVDPKIEELKALLESNSVYSKAEIDNMIENIPTGSGIEVVEQIPEQTKPGSFYFLITGTQSGSGCNSIKVSPNMGIKLVE